MAQHEEQVRKIIASHYERNDPTGWFESLYAHAKGSTEVIPWADQKPNPHLVEWLDRNSVKGEGRRAIVVGCGLGDDAKELARRGFAVTAFDISATAVEWARKRFADSGIHFEPADLLALPQEWRGAFDFVFEAYTIQALPRSLRSEAIDHVAGLVAPAGSVLVVCRGREADEPEGTLPWPLSKEEIAQFESAGLTRVSFENYFEDRRGENIRRFRALYKKG